MIGRFETVVLAPYGCPHVTAAEGDVHQCGLDVGHHGDHVPHVGSYLPPPILHPLTALPDRNPRSWVCPNCAAPVTGTTYDLMTQVLYRGQDAPQYETRFEFHPCACVVRDVVTDPGLISRFLLGDRYPC